LIDRRLDRRGVRTGRHTDNGTSQSWMR
jgi:hypothetical protein